MASDTRPTIWDDETELIQGVALRLEQGVRLTTIDATPRIRFRPGDEHETYVMWEKILRKLNGGLRRTI